MMVTPASPKPTWSRRPNFAIQTIKSLQIITKHLKDSGKRFLKQDILMKSLTKILNLIGFIDNIYIGILTTHIHEAKY